MSAIAGVVYRDARPASPDTVAAMIDRLTYRGPDGHGVWADGCVGFGHCMLHTTPESLHEHLPLVYDAGDLVLTADARIDNRDELCAGLQLQHRNTVLTDGEIIVEAYKKWGTSCPSMLLGDFVFAIWDRRTQSVFCARDCFGVKPLYYFVSDRAFVFATEIGAMFPVADVPRQLNELRVGEYLTHTFDSKTSTFYKHIVRLPPAHSIRIDRDSVAIEQYWTPDLSRTVQYRSHEDYAEAFRDLFTEAVRCRLRSVYPVGSMLSGGLDSSSIVVTAAPLLAEMGQSLHTFSAVFPSLNRTDPRIDEGTYIDTVLSSTGANVEPHFVHADTWSPLIDLLWKGEEAIPAPNLYMDWALFDAGARHNTRVLLSGFDGDSTVSYGYELFPELIRTGRWPTLLRESEAFARRLDVQQRNVVWHLGIKPLIPEPAIDLWQRIRGRYQPLWTDESTIDARFAQSIGLDAHIRKDQHSRWLWRNVPEQHWHSLSSGLLLYGVELLDKAAADRGVDVRFPFFDRRLVEFCLALPPEHKLKTGWTRAIVRTAMRDVLPEDVQTRVHKSNLSANFKNKLLHQERVRIESMLHAPPERLHRYVNLPVVRDAFDRCITYEAQSEEDFLSIYLVAVLALWLDQTDISPHTPSKAQHTSHFLEHGRPTVPGHCSTILPKEDIRMERTTPSKKTWTTPQMTVHGTVEDLTRQTKNKTFGAGDDVLVNNQAILANLS